MYSWLSAKDEHTFGASTELHNAKVNFTELIIENLDLVYIDNQDSFMF